MSRKKRYIALTEPERITLREGSKHHPKQEFREKCQALLLSHTGLAIKQIATHLGVCIQTVGSWYDDWEAKGLMGLLRAKGQGRVPILKIDNELHTRSLSQAVDKHYQDVKSIRAELSKALAKEMSTDTVKRFLKKIVFPGDAFGEIPRKVKTPKNTKTAMNA